MTADAVFWLAHDRGRPRLRPNALGLAVASGLLGELVIAGKATVIHDGSMLTCAEDPPTEHLSALVFAAIRTAAPVDPGVWLGVLRETCVAVTAERLHRAGHLEPVPAGRGARRRMPWAGPAATHVPVGRRPDEPWAVLSTRLIRRERLSDRDAYLVAIVTVTGLLPHLLVGAKPRAFDHAHDMVACLPHALSTVVAHLETAIAKDAMTPPI